jgi:plasmid stability protein
MGQILIRNLDDAALERLRLKASESNVPLERYIRDALHELSKPSRADLWERARQLREKYPVLLDDSTDLIREDRDSR